MAERCVNDNLKEKAEYYMHKAKERAEKGFEWCKEHPAEAIAIGTSALAAGKKFLGWHKVKMEDYRRLVDFYDPRTGVHAIAKKPIKGALLAEIDRRYKNGESYVKILSEMNLLK